MSHAMFYLATYFVYVLNTFIVFWYGHRLFKYRKETKTAFFAFFKRFYAFSPSFFGKNRCFSYKNKPKKPAENFRLSVISR